MGLATALLQPQSFATPERDPAAALVEDLGRLVALVAEDAASGGPMWLALEASVAAVVPLLETQLAARAAAVRTKLRSRVAGPQRWLEGLAAEATAANPGALIGLVRRIVTEAKALADTLTLPGLRAALGEVRDLVEEDLGLSARAGLGFVIAWAEAADGRLGAIAPGLDAALDRRVRLARAVLARMRLRLGSMTPPGIDTEALARLIDAAIKGSGLRAALDQITCTLGSIEAGLVAAEAAGAVVRPSPQPVGAGVVPMPGSAVYSWFGSWLLAGADLPLVGLSDLKSPALFHLLLREPRTPLARWLNGEFALAEKAVLDSHTDAAHDPPEAVQRVTLMVVNRAMQTTVFLDHAGDAFAAGPLPEDLRDLRDSHVRDRTLLEFNRRVLDHVFGDSLAGYGSNFWRGVGNGILGALSWPRNQVFVTGDAKLVMIDDRPVYAHPGGDDVRWHHAPLFTGDRHPRPQGRIWWDWKLVSPDTAETIAQVLFTSAEAGKAIWHLVGIQPGHQAQNGIIGGIEIADTIQQILFGKPVSAYFLESGGHARRWGKSLDSAVGLKGITTLATSFQGLHTTAPAGNGFLHWVTVILGDVFRVAGPIQTIGTLRDVILAGIVLTNTGGPFDGPHRSTGPEAPENWRRQGPIQGLIDTLFAMALLSLYPKDNYSIFIWSKDGIGDRRAEVMAGHWLGGSAGFGVLSGLAGSVLNQTLAWVEDWADLGKTMGGSALKLFGLYWVFNYLLVENTTDDGRHVPGGQVTARPNAVLPALPSVLRNFRGYPSKDRAPSPYLLPAPRGVGLYCGQGNLGLFSHNFINNTNFVTGNNATLQTYAYDFDHDLNEAIACCRAGTVVSFTESMPDSSTGPWNFITIRHATIDPEHDDFGAGPMQTYAVYGHLAFNGVRNAPLWGGAPPAIGAAVAQGALLALAGDTGTSFHNHLHLHILPDNGAGQPDQTFAIPFVFQDAPGNGVLKSTTWYESGNL